MTQSFFTRLALSLLLFAAACAVARGEPMPFEEDPYTGTVIYGERRFGAYEVPIPIKPAPGPLLGTFAYFGHAGYAGYPAYGGRFPGYYRHYYRPWYYTPYRYGHSPHGYGYSRDYGHHHRFHDYNVPELDAAGPIYLEGGHEEVIDGFNVPLPGGSRTRRFYW